MKEMLHTVDAPAAIGPYSQGILTAGQRLLFFSGQLPLDPVTGKMPKSIKEQTQKALENLLAVLTAGGASFENVVKTTVFLQDMSDFPAMNEVYATFFRAPFPARACIAAAALPRDALVEIEAIAVL